MRINKNIPVCKVPFLFANVSYIGNVVSCCYLKQDTSFGNLTEKSFLEIWNGEKFRTLRHRLLNKDYSLCDLKRCSIYDNEYQKLIKRFVFNYEIYLYHEEMPLPKIVSLSSGWGCNFGCITCRDKVYGQNVTYVDRTETRQMWFLSACKNALLVCSCGSGEVFFENVQKETVKTVAKNYPAVKFSLLSNGSLCDYDHWEELGIVGRVSSVSISLHASTAQTHEKITRTKTFKKVVENLEWLKTLKNDGKIQHLELIFVVSQVNYKEMPAFIKFGERFSADVRFWGVQKWGMDQKIYDNLNIMDPKNAKFFDFARMLIKNKKIFLESQNCHLTNDFVRIINMNRLWFLFLRSIWLCKLYIKIIIKLKCLKKKH